MADNIPIGFRFRPTEEELISLLWLRVTNQLDETDHVKEKILYGEGAEPWNVLGDDDLGWQIYDESGNRASTKRMVYLFTKLTKLSPKKTARTAGLGTWDGETKSYPVEDMITGEKIGSRRMLSYVLKSGSEGVKGGWIMHEYSLDGVSLKGINSSHNTDYVLCRIIKDDSKHTKVKESAKKGKVAKETEVGNRGCREVVLGKRKMNLEQETSQMTKKSSNQPGTPVDEAESLRLTTQATQASRPMELRNLVDCNDDGGTRHLQTYTGLLLDDDVRSMNCWKGDANLGSVPDMLQSTRESSLQDGGVFQEVAPSSNVGNHWFAATIDGVGNSEVTCENLENWPQPLEVQLLEPPPTHSSVDCGGQMMITCKEGQLAESNLSDSCTWEDILRSVEGGSEEIFGRLPLPQDEFASGRPMYLINA